MKVLTLVFLCLITQSFAGEVIELQRGVQVKNQDIIASVNEVMRESIYWEDEGYEFNMLSTTNTVFIMKIFKNDAGETEKLELEAMVRAGGFGWHEGYQEGYSDCRVTLYKNNGSWKDAEGDADCEMIWDF